MRRRLLSLALLGLLAATPTAASGQGIMPFFGGGLAMGAGDLSDGTENGWIVFGGFNVPVASVPGVWWGVNASYAHIPHEGNTDEATNIPGAFVNIGYTVGAATPSMVKPYLTAGIGAAQHRYDPGNTTFSSEEETKFGAQIGAGLNFVMTSFTPFVGAHYMNAGSSTAYYTVYFGIALRGSGTR